MNSHQTDAPVNRSSIPSSIVQGRVIAIGRHLDPASVLSIGEQASWDDFNYITLAEVEAQLKGAGSRIVR